MRDTPAKHIAESMAILEGFDPAKLSAEMEQAGRDWAHEDALASQMEETRKSLLAQYQLEFMSEGLVAKPGMNAKPISATAAELKALADQRYMLHLEMMVEARKRANSARVRYDSVRVKLELMRSLQATIRNEMAMNRFN